MILGFSGHRRIDRPERWSWVRAQFEAILHDAADRGDRVVSALADGGDQVFVQAAVDGGVPFEIVVPCEGYETTFEDPAVRVRHDVLLGRAAHVTTLGFTAPSDDAYLAAGRWVVDRASVLVTLWNGKPAAGRGGTGDVVAYARAQGRPVVHVDPDLLRVVRLDPDDDLG